MGQHQARLWLALFARQLSRADTPPGVCLRSRLQHVQLCPCRAASGPPRPPSLAVRGRACQRQPGAGVRACCPLYQVTTRGTPCTTHIAADPPPRCAPGGARPREASELPSYAFPFSLHQLVLLKAYAAADGDAERVAAACGASRGSVSQTLRRLEKELDTELLEPQARAPDPTPTRAAPRAPPPRREARPAPRGRLHAAAAFARAERAPAAAQTGRRRALASRRGAGYRAQLRR